MESDSERATAWVELQAHAICQGGTGAPSTPTNTAHSMLAGWHTHRAGHQQGSAANHGTCTTGPLDVLRPAREIQTRQGCME